MGAALDSEAVNKQGEIVALEVAATDSPMRAAEETVETTSAEPSFMTIDGVAARGDMHEAMYNGISYVSLRALATELDSTASIQASGGTVTVKTAELTLTATAGKQYVEANGRYLYVPGGVKDVGGIMMLPTRTIAEAFDATMVWHAADKTVSITCGSGGIKPGETFYNAEDLKWLSLIIYSESGNQPLSGKVAVGNVVMNRVRSSLFPNTIKGVILDNRGGFYQFAPAERLLQRTPNAESVIAAKLTLEGAVTVNKAMYFCTKGLNCWASRNRPYITTIANHSFYG